MVDEGARNLVLVGRRGAATAEAQDSIRLLKNKGALVVPAAVDVTQESQLETLFAEIAARMPPLRGVMHAAMVLDDGLLQHLDADRLARVMAPKALGAWHLHKLTMRLPLDFFVMFSSVASLVGNPGQGSYVAANSFLDALAHHRRALGLAATSINWGVLADVGVASKDTTLLQHLERVGMKSSQPATGGYDARPGAADASGAGRRHGIGLATMGSNQPRGRAFSALRPTHASAGGRQG